MKSNVTRILDQGFLGGVKDTVRKVNIHPVWIVFKGEIASVTQKNKEIVCAWRC